MREWLSSLPLKGKGVSSYNRHLAFQWGLLFLFIFLPFMLQGGKATKSYPVRVVTATSSPSSLTSRSTSEALSGVVSWAS